MPALKAYFPILTCGILLFVAPPLGGCITGSSTQAGAGTNLQRYGRLPGTDLTAVYFRVLFSWILDTGTSGVFVGTQKSVIIPTALLKIPLYDMLKRKEKKRRHY